MRNILIKGGPGTGKTILSRALVYYVGCCGDPVETVFSKDVQADYQQIENYVQSDYVEYIQVHASMTYEDIVYGIEINYSGSPTMSYTAKRVKKLCDRALTDNKHYYFIILDDLDRTNASSLLGNLLYAMEYRSVPVTLCDGQVLVIPDNVIIIATEGNNMYGQSMEYALRRRFDYEKELFSDKKVLDDYYSVHLKPGLKAKVLGVFEKVKNFICQYCHEDELLQKKKYIPGHGMFMVSRAGSDSDILLKLKERYIYQIHPYLVDLTRRGFITPSDQDLEQLKNSIVKYLNVGITYTTGGGSVKKILFKSKKVIKSFSLNNSLDYYKNIIVPKGCKEYRAIVENICDAIFLNGVLPIDKIMPDIMLNTNVVRFENRTRLGVYAAFLVEANQNSDYGYKTTVSKYIRSYYSSNPCKTGRWHAEKDAPEYEVIYSDGKKYSYIALNAFRNAGFDINNPVIHDKDNTASIYEALYRLVYAYLNTVYTEFSLMASSDPSYIDVSKLVGLEREYWKLENTEAQKQKGADSKLIYLATAVLNIRLLWNARGTLINVDKGKFNSLISGTVQNTAANYKDLYTIAGVKKPIMLKGVMTMVDLKDYQKIMENIGVYQMVFQGPPGTSKTFESMKFVLKQLRPVSTVFAPGTDVTQELISNELKDFKLNANDYDDPYSSPKLSTGGWDIVQFHPSYGYEDFIRGIEVKPVSGTPTYSSVNRILGKIAEFAEIAEKVAKNNNAPVPKFYLIVDEINRANLATVFGELIYGLEYRDSKVSTPYEVADRVSGIPGSKTNDIVLGKNLFIIGTMNTADKSIDSIDYAIRRRFIFIDSPAKRETVISRYQAVKGTKDEDSIELLLFDSVGTLFEGDRFFNEEYQRNDVRIGHTYFLRRNQTDYKDEMIERFVFQVIPILREYVKDGILDSDEDPNSLRHSADDIKAAVPEDRKRLMGENIMLYLKCFDEQDSSGKIIDNDYIASDIEDICNLLGY